MNTYGILIIRKTCRYEAKYFNLTSALPTCCFLLRFFEGIRLFFVKVVKSWFYANAIFYNIEFSFSTIFFLFCNSFISEFLKNERHRSNEATTESEENCFGIFTTYVFISLIHDTILANYVISRLFSRFCRYIVDCMAYFFFACKIKNSVIYDCEHVQGQLHCDRGLAKHYA